MDFHRLLRDYANNGCHTIADLPWSLFSSGRIFGTNADRVIDSFKGYRCEGGTVTHVISLKEYEGSSAHITALREFLQSISHQLFAVILHGSQADGGTTGYSDVDALVILKDAVFNHPSELESVARKLSSARRFMYRVDPLQHHGWFVLTERDLACYPEHVLPLESLSEAKVLMGESSFKVSVSKSDRLEYKAEAARVLGRLSKLLGDDWRPRNCFALKSFLSECMMLPVLYLQARDSKGWSKRDSFEAARNDFNAETWKVMESASEIRKEWSFQPGKSALLILENPAPWADKLRKYWPTPIPVKFKRRMGDDFYHSMHLLVKAMKERMDSSQV